MRKVDLIRKNMVKSVRNERNILAMTNNPFVVSFYYSFTNASNLYIVMEYCNGGDCYNLLKGLGCMSEGVARLYTAETVLALEYCHTKVGSGDYLSKTHVSTVKVKNLRIQLIYLAYHQILCSSELLPLRTCQRHFTHQNIASGLQSNSLLKLLRGSPLVCRE